MSYKVIIDQKNCQGHARCAKRAPDLFILNSDGYIATAGFDVPIGKESDAVAGARSCPERVITVLDETGQDVSRLRAAPK